MYEWLLLLELFFRIFFRITQEKVAIHTSTYCLLVLLFAGPDLVLLQAHWSLCLPHARA